MIYNILDFGAVPDGKTLNTAAIQKAIDTCYQNGGGRVLIENGTYMSGTIVLRSNVELHLAANATFFGSPDMNDYPERSDVKHVTSSLLPRWRNACYIYCEESENVISNIRFSDCTFQNLAYSAFADEKITELPMQMQVTVPIRS